MANDLTVNPLIIDTPGAGVLLTGKLYPKSVRVVDEGGSAGDNYIITDKNGVVKWETVATGANYSDAEFINKKMVPWDGLIVPTLAGGTLYIELNQRVWE